MPSEFLYNLTKNLTAHLRHYLCAVLPKFKFLGRVSPRCNRPTKWISTRKENTVLKKQQEYGMMKHSEKMIIM